MIQRWDDWRSNYYHWIITNGTGFQHIINAINIDSDNVVLNGNLIGVVAIWKIKLKK